MAKMNADFQEIKEESIVVDDSSSGEAEVEIGKTQLDAKQKVQASRLYKIKIQTLIEQRDPSIRIVLNKSERPPYNCGYFCNIFQDNKTLFVVLCKNCQRLLTLNKAEERRRSREHNLYRHSCYRDYMKGVFETFDEANAPIETTTPIIVSVTSEGTTTTEMSAGSTSSLSLPITNTNQALLQPSVAVAAAPLFKPNTKEEMVYLINSKSTEVSFSEPYKSDSYGKLGVFRVIYRNFNVQRWILCGFCNDLDIQQRHQCFLIPNALKRLQQLITDNSPLIQQKIPKNKELAAIAREIYFLSMNIDCVMCIRCERVFYKNIELHDCVEEIEIITDINIGSSSLTPVAAPPPPDKSVFPVQLSSSITREIVIPKQTTIVPVKATTMAIKPSSSSSFTTTKQTPTPPPSTVSTAPPPPPAATEPSPIIMNVQDSLNLEQEIAKCQLNFISESMIPVEKLEKNDFLNLLQMFVDIGANHGQIPIEKLLATKEELLIERSIIINSIKENLKIYLKKYKLSYSCDIWDDLNNDKTYLTLSGHFVDDNFELQSCVFGIIRFNVTVENDVLTKIYEILSEYTGLTISQTRTFLNGSVIVINIAIDVATTTSSLNTDGIHILTCCGTTINAIAEEILQTENSEIKNMCDHSAKTMKKDINTNGSNNYWDYKLKLINGYTNDTSTSSASTSTTPTNSNDKELLFVNDLNKHTYLAIFNTFQQVLISISSNLRKYPTINAVYVNRKRLIDVLQIRPTDSKQVSKFKEQTNELIQRKLHINKLYNVAVYLDPRFKSLKFMTSKEQRQTIATCKEMIISAEKSKLTNKTVIQTNDSEFVIECIDIDGDGDDDGADDDDDDNGKSIAGGSGAAKRKKRNNIIDDDDLLENDDDYLAEYMDVDHSKSRTTTSKKSSANNKIDEESIERQVDKELFIYSQLKLSTILHNVLKFWETNIELKYMRNFAKTILAIPAIAAPAACIFSPTSKLYVKNRLDLNEDDLEAWIMLNGNENDLLK